MDDVVTCVVLGPGSRRPRGFLWVVPVWFVVLGAVALAVGRHASGKVPLWLGATELGGLAIAGFTVFCVQATVRHHAFRAASAGIWIGVSTKRRRPRLRQVYLAWPDVAHLRMVPRHYGVLLEITLSPIAVTARRPGVARQAMLAFFMLLLPGFGGGRPALTAARRYPPRYRIRICDRTTGELRLALATVAPEALPLLMVPTRRALRYTIPPPREAIGRPPAPVA
jgi:hypothetical protein